MSEERLQKLILELRFLESALNDITTRQAWVTRAALDSRASLEALKALSERDSSEALVSIGAGVFMRTDVARPSSLMVSVGANVAVEKSRENTAAFLEERSQELEKASESIERQRVEVARRLEITRSEINTLLAEQKKG